MDANRVHYSVCFDGDFLDFEKLGCIFISCATVDELVFIKKEDNELKFDYLPFVLQCIL